jgi:geranylgeranyl pyrophosphate synthase
LGVFGDPEETGKSANSDLLQGKVTLLILYVLQHGSPEQIAAIKKIWGKKTADSHDIDLAKQAIKDSGSLEHSIRLTTNLATKAAQTANKLRELNLNAEAIDYLQGIAEYMVKREV